MSEPEHDQIGIGEDDKNPKPLWPWVGLLLVVVVSLLMPISALLLISERSSDPGRQEFVHIPPVLWALWAMLSLWFVLDCGRLLRIIGFRVDPLGPAALILSGLGIANIISAFGALFMSRP